jgi:hypothetical protein
VHNITRCFHHNKTPVLLLKLDISKAFNSVQWNYLISLLQHRAFAALVQLGHDTHLYLNVMCAPQWYPAPADPAWKGPQTRDPLSPLLFVLAIEPLQQLINHATARNLPSKLGSKAARFKASLYADDATIFVKPCVKILTTCHKSFRILGKPPTFTQLSTRHNLF